MGKVVVTGGGSGIGAAIAHRFAKRGNEVVVVDINEESGSEVAMGFKGTFEHLDVTDPEAWKSFASLHSDADLLFLNAGTTTNPDAAVSGSFDTPSIPLAEAGVDAYRRVSAINIDGVVFGTMAYVPHMVKRGSGHIIATASMAGLLPFPQEPIYALTKHAVVGFVRSMGVALDPYGVKMSGICPGFVHTNLLTDDILAVMRAFGLPVIEPDRVAETAERVVDEAVNGSLWFVNGEAPAAIHIPNDPSLI